MRADGVSPMLDVVSSAIRVFRRPLLTWSQLLVPDLTAKVDGVTILHYELSGPSRVFFHFWTSLVPDGVTL